MPGAANYLVEEPWVDGEALGGEELARGQTVQTHLGKTVRRSTIVKAFPLPLVPERRTLMTTRGVATGADRAPPGCCCEFERRTLTAKLSGRRTHVSMDGW